MTLKTFTASTFAADTFISIFGQEDSSALLGSLMCSASVTALLTGEGSVSVSAGGSSTASGALVDDSISGTLVGASSASGEASALADASASASSTSSASATPLRARGRPAIPFDDAPAAMPQPLRRRTRVVLHVTTWLNGVEDYTVATLVDDPEVVVTVSISFEEPQPIHVAADVVFNTASGAYADMKRAA